MDSNISLLDIIKNNRNVDITKLHSYWKRWFYQQCVYIRMLVSGTKGLIIHFPLGYINLVFQLFILIISLPIVLGQFIEFWVSTLLIIKPFFTDVTNIEDLQGRHTVVKAQINAMEGYKNMTKFLITFLLGVITTLITFYLTKHKFF